MNVITVAKSVPAEITTGVTSGQLAAAIAAAEHIDGHVFTLKASGVVLEPGDILDDLDGPGVVWELIEHVAAVAAPAPGVDVVPAADPIKVSAPSKSRTTPKDPPATDS